MVHSVRRSKVTWRMHKNEILRQKARSDDYWASCKKKTYRATVRSDF